MKIDFGRVIFFSLFNYYGIDLFKQDKYVTSVAPILFCELYRFCKFFEGNKYIKLKT